MNYDYYNNGIWICTSDYVIVIK